MRSRGALMKRLAATALLSSAAVAALELGFRAKVPACGLTPFRSSAVPGLAVELRPSFETVYKGVAVRTNSMGMRGPEVGPREPGLLRVALCGDSFTFGSGVEYEGTLAASLERALAERGTPAVVFNLGVPGYTAEEAAAAAEHRVPGLAPDVLVYVLYANDVDPPRAPMEIPANARIDPMNGFTLGSAFVEWVRIQVSRALVRSGRRPNRRTPGWSRHEYENGGGARIRSAVRRMEALCAASDARFVAVSYPHLTDPALNPFRPIDELFHRDLAALGVEAYDLLEAFGEERDLLRYWADVFDHHPSAECNARVASFLAERLSGPR
ncbi:MAG: SGNH/GDSL hydrolase family protein [Planctomycetota bacterium]|nr:SGNH/GDSL hydrolase family protein [Planctomycetota bacterium]